MKLDPITIQFAKEYADTEAEIGGFTRGSAKWKKAFAEHVSHAVSTMTVGRNPQPAGGTRKYKVKTELYPEIFQEFAKSAAKQYRTQYETEVPVTVVQDRILSAVNNMVKLFENGILGVMTTTKGNKQGHIKSDEMSQLQFPNKDEFGSQDEYDKEVRDVIFHWFMRDLITDAVLESMLPFFMMSKSDVEDIMAAVENQTAKTDVKNLMKEGREQFVKALREKAKPVFDRINYRDIIFRRSNVKALKS